jgi:HEAT repeat protein
VSFVAFAQDEEPAPGPPASDRATLEARQRVIGKIPIDPTVLINVTERELPASPDVLNLGRRSTRALERCLSDNVEATVRAHCAVMLAALGDASALPTLQTALDDWDAGVRFQVIRALQRIPAESSFEPLMKLFNRGDETPENQVAIVAALGAMSSQKAVRTLRQQLKSSKVTAQLSLHIFNALWMSRHLMDRRTLAEDVAFALASGQPALVLAATEASAELRQASLVAPLTRLV